MNIIKYEGFKNFFFGFAEDKENKHCLLIYSKTGTPDISTSQEEMIIYNSFNKTELEHIPTNVYTSLSVLFKPIAKFISIKDEEEYDKLISIVKELL